MGSDLVESREIDSGWDSAHLNDGDSGRWIEEKDRHLVCWGAVNPVVKDDGSIVYEDVKVDGRIVTYEKGDELESDELFDFLDDCGVVGEGESKGNIYLYGLWDSNTYTIEFYKDSKDEEAAVTIQVSGEEEKKSLEEAASVSNENFALEGWSTETAWSLDPDKFYGKNDSLSRADLISLADNGVIKLYAVWSYWVDYISDSSNKGEESIKQISEAVDRNAYNITIKSSNKIRATYIYKNGSVLNCTPGKRISDGSNSY